MKDKVMIIKCLILAVLPVVLCIIYAALQGGTVGKVFFPNSGWNDELFYYKQIESIVDYGYPRGYFGYDESHARILSFASWSPILYIPYVLWGYIFGWNYISPIVFGMILMSLTMLLFACLIKPDNRQFLSLAVMYISFWVVNRYIMSMMPEIMCTSLVICVLILGRKYQDNESLFVLIMMTAAAFVATLMRPYFLILLIMPGYFLIKKYNVRGFVISAGIIGLAGIAFVIINRYMTAEYIESIIITDWLNEAIKRGFTDGRYVIFGRLRTQVNGYAAYIKEFFDSGMSQGGYFLLCDIMMLVVSVKCIYDYYVLKSSLGEEAKKLECKRNNIWMEVYIVLLVGIMQMAVLLFYNLNDGAKHLMIFLLAGIFVLSAVEDSHCIVPVILAIAFFYAFGFKFAGTEETNLPFFSEKTEKKLDYWENVFAENIDTKYAMNPGFNNTIVYDSSADYTVLYSVPSGIGINCMRIGYMYDNFDAIKSRYILTTSDGAIAALCTDKHYKKLGEYENTVVYQRY